MRNNLLTIDHELSNSNILYTEDIFILNFWQMLYWKNLYFYFFFFNHVNMLYRMRSIFLHFFNFFSFYKCFNTLFLHRPLAVFSDSFLNFNQESDVLLQDYDNSLMLSPYFSYCVGLIRYNYIKVFKKKKVAYSSFDSNKLGLLLEFIPGLREKKLNWRQLKIFNFFFYVNSIRKNKLRYYKRLTRVLKRNIHR